MKKIILASKSPRRRDLLKLAGIDFDVCVSECDENITAESPESYVCALSEIKARAIINKMNLSDMENEALVIGADTIVVLNGEIIGKPKDVAEAVRILRCLSGRTHEVITGVSIINTATDRCITFFETTSVTFYDLTDDEIDSYVSTKEPFDKAGAYGIQGKGSLLVERINGDYYNVVGLPLGRLVHILKDC